MPLPLVVGAVAALAARAAAKKAAQKVAQKVAAKTAKIADNSVKVLRGSTSTTRNSSYNMHSAIKVNNAKSGVRARVEGAAVKVGQPKKVIKIRSGR